MDDLENQPPEAPKPPAPTIEELQADCEWLRRSINWVLVALVVLSFAVFFFFYRNLRNVQRDLVRIRPAAELGRVGNRNMEQFVRQLIDYSRTHPDFLPVLAKYGIRQVPGPAPTPGPTAPPATTPSQQKK